MTAPPIPNYPDFKKFEHADTAWYDKFFKEFPPYADLYSGNLRVWLDINDDLEVSNLNNSIVYRFTNVLDNNVATTTILGKNDIDRALDKLLKSASTLSFVPSVVVDNITNKARYRIEPERGSFDYILDADLLGKLEGPEFRRLRQVISYASRNYPKDIHTKIEKLTPHHRETLHRFLSTWEKTFTLTNNNEGSHELKALERNIILSNEIESYLWIFSIKGNVEGFIVFHKPPQNEYVIVNHLKTSYAFKFIFDFMLLSFAKEISQLGHNFINFEQDLDLPGLRQHKLSLKPVKLLEKYTISLA